MAVGERKERRFQKGAPAPGFLNLSLIETTGPNLVTNGKAFGNGVPIPLGLKPVQVPRPGDPG